MNTVLLSAATPDNNAMLKATSSRSSSGNSAPTDSSSDFAGVLASQATPQPQSTSTPPSGGSGTSSDTKLRNSDSTGPDTQNTARHAPRSHGAESHDIDQAAQTARLADTGSALAASHAKRTDGAASIHQHMVNAAPMVADTNAETSLPERFSQIIAAMSKVAGKTAAPGGDGKYSGADKLSTTPETIDRMTSSGRKGSEHHPHHNSRYGSTPHSWNPQTHSARNMSRPDIGTDAHASAAQEKGGMLLREPAPFNLTEPRHIQAEGNIMQALQNTASAPDASINPGIPAVTAFSLLPGSAQRGDMMINSAALNQSVYSQHWAPELGRQFISIIRPGENGNHSAELRLDPPELGPLRITININDSVVQALFTSSHATVRNAVENALPLLQQHLEQEGLSLGHASVDHDDGSPGSSPQHGGTPSSGGETRVATTTPPVRQRAPDALVDTFA